jgi:hypothetical protein
MEEGGVEIIAALVVADQASEARLPGKGPLKHPVIMPLRR